METDIIPTFDNNHKKVVGIKIGDIEIPFKNQLLFQEFVDTYYKPLQISLQLLEISKISGEYRTEWTDEELKNFIQESNYIQVIILNTLRMNKTLTREGILQVIRQLNRHKVFSARQLGPQIGGIKVRTNNMKKEDLIHIDSRNQIYSLNEKYRKRIKDFLIESLEDFDL